MANKTFTCCLCGKKFIGYGNNPWPCNTDPEARCCDDCNSKKVIPARILQLMNTNK